MKRVISFLLLLLVLTTTYAASCSGTLPVMHIQTQNNAPIVSKEDYLNATYYIDALGISGYQNIGSATTPLSMEIKGRGNWTWRGFDKKPYRIKFESKQKPLDAPAKAKKWTIIISAL